MKSVPLTLSQDDLAAIGNALDTASKATQTLIVKNQGDPALTQVIAGLKSNIEQLKRLEGAIWTAHKATGGTIEIERPLAPSPAFTPHEALADTAVIAIDELRQVSPSESVKTRILHICERALEFGFTPVFYGMTREEIQTDVPTDVSKWLHATTYYSYIELRQYQQDRTGTIRTELSFTVATFTHHTQWVIRNYLLP